MQSLFIFLQNFYVQIFFKQVSENCASFWLLVFFFLFVLLLCCFGSMTMRLTDMKKKRKTRILERNLREEFWGQWNPVYFFQWNFCIFFSGIFVFFSEFCIIFNGILYFFQWNFVLFLVEFLYFFSGILWLIPQQLKSVNKMNIILHIPSSGIRSVQRGLLPPPLLPWGGRTLRLQGPRHYGGAQGQVSTPSPGIMGALRAGGVQLKFQYLGL